MFYELLEQESRGLCDYYDEEDGQNHGSYSNGIGFVLSDERTTDGLVNPELTVVYT